MPKLNILSLAALALLTLLAAHIRSLALGDGLWLDELHTSWTAADGLGEIGPRARLGNQQPLYFYLPWISIGLFGESEWALRLPSYLAGIALIPALYWLAWKWTGSSLAAIAAAAMATLDRQWLFYAQEARVYAIVQLAAVVQFSLLARLMERPTPKLRIAHAALAALMFYLHYTTALLIIAEAAAWLAFWRMRRHGGDRAELPYGWRPAARDAAMYLLLIVPALPHVWTVSQRRENWTQFVQQPSWWDWSLVFPLDVYVIAPLVIAGFLAVNDKLLHRRWPEVPRKKTLQQRQAVIAACWLVVPLALAWLATTTDVARLYFPRYLIGASAAALLIAAYCVAWQRFTAARWVVALALLCLAAWRGEWLSPRPYSGALSVHSGEQWREAIAAISRLDPQGEFPLLVDAGLIESEAWHGSSQDLLREYCTLPVRGIYQLPATGRPILPLFAGRALASEGEFSAIAASPSCFMLQRGRKQTDRLMIVSPSGQQLHLRIGERQRFGYVTLKHAAPE